jgi:hypothetical protein
LGKIEFFHDPTKNNPVTPVLQKEIRSHTGSIMALASALEIEPKFPRSLSKPSQESGGKFACKSWLTPIESCRIDVLKRFQGSAAIPKQPRKGLGLANQLNTYGIARAKICQRTFPARRLGL